jgi:hypothetical protein
MTYTSVQNVALQEVQVGKVSLDRSFPIQPNDSAETKEFAEL